jgi:hypothetical protein
LVKGPRDLEVGILIKQNRRVCPPIREDEERSDEFIEERLRTKIIEEQPNLLWKDREGQGRMNLTFGSQ